LISGKPRQGYGPDGSIHPWSDQISERRRDDAPIYSFNKRLNASRTTLTSSDFVQIPVCNRHVTTAYAKWSYNGPADSVEHDLGTNNAIQECCTDPFALHFG
jgi:hypothetical protein